MANEVVVELYKAFNSDMKIRTIPTSTIIVDSGSRIQIPSGTKYIRINPLVDGVWYKFGGDAVTAALNEVGSIPLLASGDHQVSGGEYIHVVV